MREWATSGRVKIDRASEHIRNLESEIAGFRARRPYFVIPQRNPDGWEGTRFVVSAEQIPARWSAIAADAVHNLHVALDHLWQRAIYGTRSGRHDHFPAFPNPERAKARFKGNEQGRRKTAVGILYQVKAFEVGNPFWCIRCFDDTDKHDTMTLVACPIQNVRVDLFKMLNKFSDELGHGIFDLTFPPEAVRVLEDGAELYLLAGPPPEMEVEHEIDFEVAFGESEVLKREAVLPSLRNLTAAVANLATNFEASGLV
jgi:hypothetical protein